MATHKFNGVLYELYSQVQLQVTDKAKTEGCIEREYVALWFDREGNWLVETRQTSRNTCASWSTPLTEAKAREWYDAIAAVVIDEIDDTIHPLNDFYFEFGERTD